MNINIYNRDTISPMVRIFISNDKFAFDAFWRIFIDTIIHSDVILTYTKSMIARENTFNITVYPVSLNSNYKFINDIHRVCSKESLVYEHSMSICGIPTRSYPEIPSSNGRKYQSIAEFLLECTCISVHVFKRGATICQVVDELPVILHFSQCVGLGAVAFVAVVKEAQFVFILQPFAYLIYNGELDLPFSAAHCVITVIIVISTVE